LGGIKGGSLEVDGTQVHKRKLFVGGIKASMKGKGRAHPLGNERKGV